MPDCLTSSFAVISPNGESWWSMLFDQLCPDLGNKAPDLLLFMRRQVENALDMTLWNNQRVPFSNGILVVERQTIVTSNPDSFRCYCAKWAISSHVVNKSRIQPRIFARGFHQQTWTGHAKNVPAIISPWYGKEPRRISFRTVPQKPPGNSMGRF